MLVRVCFFSMLIPALALCLCLSSAGVSTAQDCDAAYKDIETLNDVEELQARVEKYPDCADLYIVLGDVAYEREFWLDAEKWYAKALESYPDDSFLQDRHAECLRKKPIALDDMAGLDVDREIEKRGLGGARGLPPMSLEIEFQTGSARLDPAAKTSLDSFAALIGQKFSDYRFEVQGHTDNVGSPQNNKDLSLRRADAVKNYLVENHGIDATRLQVAGYGESRPLASNATAEGKARNRRVQFQGFK